MNEIDPRIVKVSISVNGKIKTYSSPMFISITGMKYGNALQNEAEVIIANLDRSTQDYLLTETSPFNLNRTPKSVTIEAGRVSYGTSVIYSGNIVTSMLTQPPDVGITLKCLTGNFIKGSVISRNQSSQTSLKQICSQIAQDTNTILNFQASDRSIANYAFSGASLKQIDAINAMGNINAYIDNNQLVVKNAFVPTNAPTKILSAASGMVGIPEFTEQGIRVKYLLDNVTTLGGRLRINSKIYPACNGDYVIYKLGFQIATRDVPFYYIAEASRFRS